MLQPVKDNPNLVKDTESKAILTKDDSPQAIRIRNLVKKVQELEKRIEQLENK
jgi:hypothetical protein